MHCCALHCREHASDLRCLHLPVIRNVSPGHVIAITKVNTTRPH